MSLLFNDIFIMVNNIIDNVLLPYVCYGLNSSCVPVTINAFSEKKDVIWIHCKAHLIEKPNRVASVNRTEKMAHLNVRCIIILFI